MVVMSSYRIHGATGEWEVVIGLEVHAQVTSNAKLFSGASTEFGAEPNSQVSLVDAAMPGMLPVLNGECVRQAVRTGMALNAAINCMSRFDRKNYFYPDLPQGYQISQLYHPIVGEGVIEVEVGEGAAERKQIGVERIHLEQDAGKMLHDQHAFSSRGRGLCQEAEIDSEVCRLVRRQYGAGIDARRRQCQRPKARRPARHAHRDQERQFGPLHHGRDRI
jgi:Asp-tRNA(Asn)/Glu-tRNA(Gln) amidotransferase B subunit